MNVKPFRSSRERYNILFLNEIFFQSATDRATPPDIGLQVRNSYIFAPRLNAPAEGAPGEAWLS
jgi:hypothetical protein